MISAGLLKSSGSGPVWQAFTKTERSEHCVVFWDTKLHGHQVKYVANLIDVVAAGDHCVLSTRTTDGSGQFVLILCNANGTPVDSKYIDIKPDRIAMTKTHVVAASENCVYVWHYSGGLGETERVFHIDEGPSRDDKGAFKKSHLETEDEIVCIALTEKTLMVGRESGMLHEYVLPRVSLDAKYVLNCRPEVLAINCDGSKVSVIDIAGVMTMFDTTADSEADGAKGAHIAGFERKDVWDMKWADDNPDLLAIMERTSMYIFRGTDPEEPFKNHIGWIAEFNDLQVRSLCLDDLMQDPEQPVKESIVDVEIKSLRDTRVLLNQVGIEDAAVFVEDNPHPRLWQLLAESALAKLDLDISERAFVRCDSPVNYQGIEFIKRLNRLDDPVKQQAEVAVYFQRFEEAERRYHEIDRPGSTWVSCLGF